MVSDRKQPIEIMRQVQIAAGVMVVTGVLMGALVAPALYGLAAFVGAGLLTVVGGLLGARLGLPPPISAGDL